MKSKGVINMIEETTPDYLEKTFKDVVPEYSFPFLREKNTTDRIDM